MLDDSVVTNRVIFDEYYRQQLDAMEVYNHPMTENFRESFNQLAAAVSSNKSEPIGNADTYSIQCFADSLDDRGGYSHEMRLAILVISIMEYAAQEELDVAGSIIARARNLREIS